MATASNADSEASPDADAEPRSNADAESHSDADAELRPDDSSNEVTAASANDAADTSSDEAESSSLADKLDTAATVVWWSFLALVVVFTLIPAVALWFGTVPPTVTAPEPGTTTRYFAFVGLAVLGTAALVGAAILDA